MKIHGTTTVNTVVKNGFCKLIYFLIPRFWVVLCMLILQKIHICAERLHSHQLFMNIYVSFIWNKITRLLLCFLDIDLCLLEQCFQLANLKKTRTTLILAQTYWKHVAIISALKVKLRQRTLTLRDLLMRKFIQLRVSILHVWHLLLSS